MSRLRKSCNSCSSANASSSAFLVKKHFWDGKRIFKEGTLIEEVDSRFLDCVEEVEPSAERREVEPPEEEPEQVQQKLKGHHTGHKPKVRLK